MDFEDMSGEEKVVTILVGLLVVAVTLSIPVISTYFEMRTFNRCTGSQASFMDALFSNLRVTECKKP